MSHPPPARPEAESRTEGPAVRGPWSVSTRGVLAVAGHELRSRRVRASWGLLGRWTLGYGIFTLLLGTIVYLTLGPGGHDGPPPAGRVVFGVVTLLALTVSLVVATAVSAPALSLVRDPRLLRIRARVHRPVRVASATAAERVGGALLAAWTVAAGSFVAAVPSLAATLLLGDVPWTALVTVPLVGSVLLAAVCAVGLAISASDRPAESALHRTGGAVAALSVGGIVAFVLTLGLVADTNLARAGVPTAAASSCGPVPAPRVVRHTERTWWLLAPSPFVVVSDAAFPVDRTAPDTGSDPLSSIRDAVRTARSDPAARRPCAVGDGPFIEPVDRASIDRAVVWPWGLGANLVLGAAAATIAVRRLAAR